MSVVAQIVGPPLRYFTAHAAAVNVAIPDRADNLTENDNAFINYARWIVVCQDCNMGSMVRMDYPYWFCSLCLSWRNVVFPAEFTAIETALLPLPVHLTHWRTSQSVMQLESIIEQYNQYFMTQGDYPDRLQNAREIYWWTFSEAYTLLNANYNAQVMRDIIGRNGSIQLEHAIKPTANEDSGGLGFDGNVYKYGDNSLLGYRTDLTRTSIFVTNSDFNLSAISAILNTYGTLKFRSASSAYSFEGSVRQDLAPLLHYVPGDSLFRIFKHGETFNSIYDGTFRFSTSSGNNLAINGTTHASPSDILIVSGTSYSFSLPVDDTENVLMSTAGFM